jgi:HK97 family phage prohead protease
MRTAKGLCGFATVYSKILFHGGVWQMIMPYAFNKSLMAPIELWLNQQYELCVGSNRDGVLELNSNDIGLAMRARLPDTEHGRTARWMAENGHKGASIGFSWGTAKKEVRRIDGQDVVCIHEAHLYEASYLFGSGPGAVKESYITYKDIDFSKSLEGQCSNFAYEGAAIGVTRALEKLLANTKS